MLKNGLKRCIVNKMMSSKNIDTLNFVPLQVPKKVVKQSVFAFKQPKHRSRKSLINILPTAAKLSEVEELPDAFRLK